MNGGSIAVVEDENAASSSLDEVITSCEVCLLLLLICWRVIVSSFRRESPRRVSSRSLHCMHVRRRASIAETGAGNDQGVLARVRISFQPFFLNFIVRIRFIRFIHSILTYLKYVAIPLTCQFVHSSLELLGDDGLPTQTLFRAIDGRMPGEL